MASPSDTPDSSPEKSPGPVPQPAPLYVASGPVPGGSTTSTAAVAMTTAGSGAMVIWLFACIEQGQIVTPSNECALFMAAALLPLAHTLRNGLNAMLGRWFKVEPTQL